jgi:hypothetical protein
LFIIENNCSIIIYHLNSVKFLIETWKSISFSQKCHIIIRNSIEKSFNVENVFYPGFKKRYFVSFRFVSQIFTFRFVSFLVPRFFCVVSFLKFFHFVSFRFLNTGFIIKFLIETWKSTSFSQKWCQNTCFQSLYVEKSNIKQFKKWVAYPQEDCLFTNLHGDSWRPPKKYV